MSFYPDYGTPGAPNLDPYYRSPAQIVDDEAMHDAATFDLSAGLDDLILEARKANILTARQVADILRFAADRLVPESAS